MVRTGVMLASLLLAGLSSPALAQVSATTGAINGRVSDPTGGVLPGVSVTIASQSMQGTRSDVTNAQGDYRFPAVPPGEYRITCELAGFGEVISCNVKESRHPPLDGLERHGTAISDAYNVLQTMVLEGTKR